MFLLSSANSVTKLFVCKRARTCHLLCLRQECDHGISKTHVRDGIFKFEPNSCFSDLSDSPNSLNSLKVLLHLGKTPLILFFPIRVSFTNTTYFAQWSQSISWDHTF